MLTKAVREAVCRTAAVAFSKTHIREQDTAVGGVAVQTLRLTVEGAMAR